MTVSSEATQEKALKKAHTTKFEEKKLTQSNLKKAHTIKFEKKAHTIKFEKKSSHNQI